MTITDSQILNEIVRPVLADCLGIEYPKDIWLTHRLKDEDLNATEWYDFETIAWQFRQLFDRRKLGITIEAKELEEGKILVSELLRLIARKLDEQEVPVSEIVFVK